jgi:hypothetical protein
MCVLCALARMLVCWHRFCLLYLWLSLDGLSRFRYQAHVARPVASCRLSARVVWLCVRAHHALI